MRTVLKWQNKTTKFPLKGDVCAFLYFYATENFPVEKKRRFSTDTQSTVTRLKSTSAKRASVLND